MNDIIKPSAGRYTLEFPDNSMSGIGIYAGDTVVIDTNAPIKNGDIAAILVNRKEATLRRYYLLGDRVELKAENPNLISEYHRPRDIELQGKMVGIFRKY